jgi:hypothetical protein
MSAKKGVPPDREVHLPAEGFLGFGIETAVELVHGAVEQPRQAGTVEHERATTPAEVVDHVEGTHASVQRCREPTAVPLREPPEQANSRE